MKNEYGFDMYQEVVVIKPQFNKVEREVLKYKLINNKIERHINHLDKMIDECRELINMFNNKL